MAPVASSIPSRNTLQSPSIKSPLPSKFKVQSNVNSSVVPVSGIEVMPVIIAVPLEFIEPAKGIVIPFSVNVPLSEQSVWLTLPITMKGSSSGSTQSFAVSLKPKEPEPDMSGQSSPDMPLLSSPPSVPPPPQPTLEPKATKMINKTVLSVFTQTRSCMSMLAHICKLSPFIALTSHSTYLAI